MAILSGFRRVFVSCLYLAFESASEFLSRFERKEWAKMNTMGRLERLLIAGEITEEQYRERKETYIETILELYVKGIISKEQLREKLNQWPATPRRNPGFFFSKKTWKFLKKSIDIF